MATATLASLEQLVTEQTAHFYAVDTANEARAESRLFDAAVAAGMSWDHDDLHGWVAERVGEFLLSGPSDDEDFWGDDGIAMNDAGQWEYAA